MDETTPSPSADAVTLIVKASNQQFADQSINCEATWTVRKLKEHLALVYPCKPLANEQKLIYSGQLLKDNLIIKDILRSYEEASKTPIHIFHLVYAPKTQRPMPTIQKPTIPTTSSNTDGLRQRNVPNVDTNLNPQQATNAINPNAIPQMMTPTAAVPSRASSLNCLTNAAGMYGVPFGPATNDNILAQQRAMQVWMQQVYFQYLSQYANMSTAQSQLPSAGNTHMNGSTTPLLPFMPPNFPAFANWQPQFGVAPGQPNGQTNTVVPNNNNIVDGQNPQGVPVIHGMQPQPPMPNGPAHPAVPEHQPQPRFPNIVQEEQENQDWLDLFYSFSRLLMLMMLVYVYSSPERCALVLFIALAIYLYHNGVLNLNPNNNNNRRNVADRQRAPLPLPVVNNNPVPAQPEAVAEPAVEQEPPPPQQQLQDGEPNTPSQETNIVPEAEEHQGPSAIGLFKTIVVSFFTSLLPDPPAL